MGNIWVVYLWTEQSTNGTALLVSFTKKEAEEYMSRRKKRNSGSVYSIVEYEPK